MNDMLAAIMPALAWALLDFIWQGLLIGCIAALGFVALRGARPQARYAFGCAALLLCAALPVAGTVQRVLDARAVATTVLPLPAIATAGAAQAGEAAPLLAARLAAWEPVLQQRLPLLMFFWSCGAGLLALRLMLGLAWVRRRSQPGQYRQDAAWQARVDRLALRFGIARKVALGLVDDLGSPVTAGWWRPVVLVPASLLTGMPPDLLEALLAHEMAHIKRLDYLVNLIQSAIEILLFYHPAVWWLSNRIRIEREQIADDLAASMLGEPRRLALALSELDQFQFATPQLAHGAHGGNLMSRIKRLVRPDTEPLNWKMALPILGLSAACAGFYANAQTAPAASATTYRADAVTPAAPAEPPMPPVPAMPAMPAKPARPAMPPMPVNPAMPPVPPAPPALPMAARPAPAPAPLAVLAMATPPVPPTPPLPPAPPRPPVSVTKGHGEMSYALVQGAERKGMMSGDSRDFDDIAAAKQSVKGDFLWFRKGDTPYVVQDPALIARMTEAYAPIQRIGKQMEAYGKEMEHHGHAMEKLGRDMERTVATTAPDDADMRKTQGLLAALGAQRARLGLQLAQAEVKRDEASGAERNRLAREREQMHDNLRDIERQIDQQQDKIERHHSEREAARREPREAIRKQMEQSRQPMDVLSKKMDALGREMDQHSKAAERTMREVLRDAVARGLAQPVAARRAG